MARNPIRVRGFKINPGYNPFVVLGASQPIGPFHESCVSVDFYITPDEADALAVDLRLAADVAREQVVM